MPEVRWDGKRWSRGCFQKAHRNSTLPRSDSLPTFAEVSVSDFSALWVSIGSLITTIASFLYILEFFGFQPKSWKANWWLMPSSRKWKLVIMLVLVTTSFLFSGYGFYRALHPKIVEKI